MASKKSAKNHVGIVFAPPVVYPPLAQQHAAHVIVSSLLPEMSSDDFDYALNSEPGQVEGISLTVSGYKSGTVHIRPAFTEHYRGPWPARLEVRYWKDGKVADLGVLYFRDTRTAVPDRMVVDVAQNTVDIPPIGEETSVHFLATLVDRDGYAFPHEGDMMSWWALELVQPTQGVTVDANLLMIRSDAQPGEVNVRVSTTVGFEEIVTITLI